ncbi:putative SGNH hydrolase-type esterase domain-containing protein [Heracleum sosnowskyi]|uniref:SGNH hydrolase-type esterase domain-containing protein n=1 Tax=Heracleum sosnowskyi TaxID=360622 RepID=A0AAD8IVQ4_9APIA|nr:putative SGNH hydrolase-type esterase domain-containing protein [Heracleum sosnowskyi]
MYVLGDSLVDVGNNNYLRLSLDKADFSHNGVDFPTGPTGRFCNGKNTADFIAEKLGLPSPPAYFSLSNRDINTTILTGVSFASGGAGILNGTYSTFRQAISLSKQVDYYTAVYETLVQELGFDTTQKHLSKSLFVIVIGSNDLKRYFSDSEISKSITPQDYVNSMVSAINDIFKQLYGLGARKFILAGVPVVGCTPKLRIQNETLTCHEELNFWVTKYNDGLKSVLQKFKFEFNDTSYSYFDTYSALNDFIQNPNTYGFIEVQSACCGLGKLRAAVPCLPISEYCSNRNDYLFWDLYHPTEKTASMFIDMFYNASQYVTPINISQLVSL